MNPNANQLNLASKVTPQFSLKQILVLGFESVKEKKLP